MKTIVPVETDTRLSASYMVHPSEQEGEKLFGAFVHGMSHTRNHALDLIDEVTPHGIDAVTTDIQSEKAWFKNAISIKSYVRALSKTLHTIEEETRRRIDFVCGHSMGGRMLQMAMDADPTLRRPTVLMAPVPLTSAWPATQRAIGRDWKKMATMALKRDVLHAMKTPDDVRTLFFDGETPDEIVLATMSELRHTSFRAYLSLGNPSSLSTTDQKTLLLRSDTDELFWDEKYETERALYGDNLTEIALPRGGHDFFIEFAKDTAKHIADFAHENAT